MIAEQATGFPGYDSIITKDKATIGTILKDNGYRTSWFGKNHNTPAFQASPTGPFDQWPTGMGFEYFYGFMGGDTSQWQPGNLARNTTLHLSLPGQPRYNLITAMADEAIGYMNQVNTLTPGPALLRLLRAGRHPRAAPSDAGVDQEDQRHAPLRRGLEQAARPDLRQPEEARRHPAERQADALAGRPAEGRGTQLTADEKKMFIRQVDVYAAYLAYTDHEIGRVIQAVEDMGKLDNTLIIYISGDNGSSAEGTLHRHAERGRHVQRRRGAGRGPAQVLLRRLGLGPDLQPHGGAVDLGLRHAVLVDQADRLALRRHQAGHGDLLAEGDQGQGRHPQPVPPRHRHRADHPRGHAASAQPAMVDGIAQSPIEGVEHGLHLRQGERRRAVDTTGPSTSR